MPLCFIEPQDAIRVIAESVGREARRQLVGEIDVRLLADGAGLVASVVIARLVWG